MKFASVCEPRSDLNRWPAVLVDEGRSKFFSMIRYLIGLNVSKRFYLLRSKLASFGRKNMPYFGKPSVILKSNCPSDKICSLFQKTTLKNESFKKLVYIFHVFENNLKGKTAVST